MVRFISTTDFVQNTKFFCREKMIQYMSYAFKEHIC